VLVDNKQWHEIMVKKDSECFDSKYPASDSQWATHRAACQLGEFDRAMEIEERLAEKIAEVKESASSEKTDEMTPVLQFMRGTRLALSGDLEAAEKAFRTVDGSVSYRNSGLGMLKLYNRVLLVETLLSLGHDAEAHKLLAQVRAVNPVIVSEFEEDGLKIMGLSRS